jgi:diguanylate cyclase
MEGGVSDGLESCSLVEMTRSMIERTQKLEADMRRSESEITSLRKSLTRAKRAADLDHLTGLPNRRAFEAVLEREYREARAACEPLTIAICDIDKFKVINDTHGHDTGDRVIQAVAETFGRVSNDRCHVARHGGEEFVLLFRGMTPDVAKTRLDGVRESFAMRHFVNREDDKPIGHVTFSGGLANVFSFVDPRAALAAADQALYRAKQQGRNQICVAA